MTDPKDMHDVYRHRNLQRMGRELALPAEPDPQRVERWKLSRPPASQTEPSRTIGFVQRHKPMALLTASIAAAALTFAVWLGVGGSTPVSAETILDSFQTALTQAVTIRIEGVDLGNVTIDGEIILDRAAGEPNENMDTFYSELHVVLKADNPDWNDLDGVIVVCQSPTQAWVYCRGNGGSSGGLFAPRRVRPTEYLAKGTNWPEFVKDPLGYFASPIQLTFHSRNSQVRYSFFAPQRAYVRQLLHFLLDLSNAETAEGLIAELQAAAGRTSVTRADDGTWVMHASDFGRIGSFEPPQPEMLDLEALMQGMELSVYFDADAGTVRRAEFRNIASPGSRITLELGQVKLDPARLDPDRWVTEYTVIYEASTNP